MNFAVLNCLLKWGLQVHIVLSAELLERMHLLIAPSGEAATQVWHSVSKLHVVFFASIAVDEVIDFRCPKVAVNFISDSFGLVSIENWVQFECHAPTPEDYGEDMALTVPAVVLVV